MREVESAKSVMEPAAWLLQMITGLAMVFLVTLHFYITHLVSHESLRYHEVVERLSLPEYKVMYAILLLVVSFHAFNGLRAIALDTGGGMRSRGVINLLTMLMFLVAFLYGIYLLINIY